MASPQPTISSWIVSNLGTWFWGRHWWQWSSIPVLTDPWSVTTSGPLRSTLKQSPSSLSSSFSSIKYPYLYGRAISRLTHRILWRPRAYRGCYLLFFGSLHMQSSILTNLWVFCRSMWDTGLCFPRWLTAPLWQISCICGSRRFGAGLWVCPRMSDCNMPVFVGREILY